MYRKKYDPEIFKKALGNLFKRKEYHVATPTKKNEMLRVEYVKIISKEKKLKHRVSYAKKIERRASERIPINLNAKFFYRRKVYTGNVINLSENGMGIETDKCLPLKSKFEVFIKGGDVTVPVKVSRLIEQGNVFSGMGIELVEQPPNYIKLVATSH